MALDSLNVTNGPYIPFLHGGQHGGKSVFIMAHCAIPIHTISKECKASIVPT